MAAMPVRHRTQVAPSSACAGDVSFQGESMRRVKQTRWASRAVGSARSLSSREQPDGRDRLAEHRSAAGGDLTSTVFLIAVIASIS